MTEVCEGKSKKGRESEFVSRKVMNPCSPVANEGDFVQLRLDLQIRLVRAELQGVEVKRIERRNAR